MNYIKINTTKNIQPFELPRSQEFHDILKSMLMFEELNFIMSDSDVFTFDKENGYYILLHKSLKAGLEKPIMAFTRESIQNIRMKVLHQYMVKYIYDAWVEYRLIL